MTILIVASTKDLAARNIAEKLMKLQNFKESEMVFDGNRVYKNGVPCLHTLILTQFTQII